MLLDDEVIALKLWMLLHGQERFKSTSQSQDLTSEGLMDQYNATVNTLQYLANCLSEKFTLPNLSLHNF